MGKDFDALPPAGADQRPQSAEDGRAQLNRISGKQLFEALLDIVMEGFFAVDVGVANKSRFLYRVGRAAG